MIAKEIKVIKCELCNKFYDINIYDICPHCGEKVEKGKEINNKNLIDEQIEKESSNNSSSQLIFNEKEKNNGIFKRMFSLKKTKEENRKVDSEVIEKPSKDSLSEEDENISAIIPNSNVIAKPDSHGDYQSNNIHDEDMRTVMVKTITESMVVGWFVCIKGECLGKSFEIKSGNNNLGRGSNNDICINDSTVSREQAIVTFEPRKQNFYIKPKDNSQFIYIDGDEIDNRVQMKPYMHIEIGEKTEFVFVPFCGENFNWKDYTEEY